MLTIDEKRTEEKIVHFIQEKTAGFEGVAIGLSGGIDSALTAALAVKALGQKKVHALILPSEYTRKDDIEDAKDVARSIGIDYRTIDITPIFTEIRKHTSSTDKKAHGNILARTRMILLRDYAYSKNLLVIGTGNKSELMVGYFTKDGDGAVDILPIGGLYKTQVRRLAKHTGISDKIIEKAPSAGLWSGQEDEKELGITYEKLDIILDMLEKGKTPEDIEKETSSDRGAIEKVRQMIKNSAHKRDPTPICRI